MRVSSAAFKLYPTLALSNSHNNVFRSDIQPAEVQNPERSSKIIDQNNSRNILLALGTLGLFFVGFSLIWNKKAGRSSNRAAKNVYKDFENFRNNKDIPTLDTCKSLNKNLLDCLQQRVNYINTSQELKNKLGKTTDENCILLIGNPGVGKSFFGKILAKTIDADYMEIKFADYNSSIIGEDIEKMQSIFEHILLTADSNPEKKYVIVFNEIDAVLQPIEKLSHWNSNSRHLMYKIEERGTWLQYLEKIMEKPNLYIIGTTNQSAANNNLDGASLSRFKHVIEVHSPKKEAFLESVKFKLNQFEIGQPLAAASGDLNDLAKLMEERKCSFRDLNKIIERSKDLYLEDYVKNNNVKYNIDYLKKALKSIEKTDGEIVNSVNKREGQKNESKFSLSKLWNLFKPKRNT